MRVNTDSCFTENLDEYPYLPGLTTDKLYAYFENQFTRDSPGLSHFPKIMFLPIISLSRVQTRGMMPNGHNGTTIMKSLYMHSFANRM
mmetsp:Transcript_4827/g.7307  ORF Transcript_4827/g.7307 Transcript_4827/m.7307 type:complete len:88 (+) Transcript_4827:484-747(+)